MKVLVACEFSGRVRDAFLRLGHEALSCDFLPTETDGPHYKGDVRDVIDYPWDLVIAHPPCTHLSASGARHFAEKRHDGRQQVAVSFFLMFCKLECMTCIENPVSIISTLYRKPNQIIQPWQYGHGETKTTCLWLRGLPTLQPTKVVEGRESRIHRMPDTRNRAKNRSRTYTGIATAMADQWGGLV